MAGCKHRRECRRSEQINPDNVEEEWDPRRHDGAKTDEGVGLYPLDADYMQHGTRVERRCTRGVFKVDYKTGRRNPVCRRNCPTAGRQTRNGQCRTRGVTRPYFKTGKEVARSGNGI